MKNVQIYKSLNNCLFLNTSDDEAINNTNNKIINYANKLNNNR